MSTFTPLTRLTVACLLALAAAAAPTASAQSMLYFLDVPGAPGESAHARHPDEIVIESWRWGVTQAGPRASFSDFTWTQRLDASYVPMFLHLVSGTALRTVTLSVSRASNPLEDFFWLTLNDVQVINLETEGTGDAIRVDGALRFGGLAMRYCPRNETGAWAMGLAGLASVAGLARYRRRSALTDAVRRTLQAGSAGR